MAVLLEEFPGRLVSEIEAEIANQPVGRVRRILEARHYKRAKALVDAAQTKEQVDRLPKSPLIRLVQEIDAEIAMEQAR
jgi:hypothetical protein